MSKKTRITARINFTVRPPRTNGVGRGSFHIYKDVKPLVGKRDNKPHIFTSKDGKPDDRLDKINEGYRKCEMDFETAKKMAEALRDQLYKEHNLVKTKVFSTDNYEILDEFFQKRYASRKTKDKAAAFNDYRRAVDAVGLLPIRSASEAQLQEALSKFPNNKQRRYVSRLTRILKFKGRDDIELAKDRKQSAEIRYLSEKEFSAVLKNVEDKNLQIVFQMAFHSGCRLGEIFALDDEDYRNGILNVSKQFIREEIAKKRKLFKIVKGQKVLDLIQPTKNEQKRRVVVFSEFKNCFEQWILLSHEEKTALRKSRFAEILKTACELTFPNRLDKHCVAHDLRHSFAIRNLHKDINLTYVAQQLGNRIEVCQEYYTGYVLQDEAIEILKLKLRSPRKRKTA